MPTAVNGWPLPPGRHVPVEGRGSVFIREVAGPAGAPAVALLHGLGATSGLQFAPTMNQLGEAFRVVAIDMRAAVGTVDGSRSLFVSVADDVAAALSACELSRVIVFGYSLGGLVARMLAARHPDLVGGIVFAATFDQLPQGRLLAPVRLAANLVPRVPSLPGRSGGSSDEPESGLARWLLREMGKLSPAVLSAAVRDVLVGSIPPVPDDVPTAFIITTRDRLIAPRWQRAFAATAPDAPVFEVAAGHAASGLAPDRFGPAAIAACESVVSRMPAP